MKKIVIILSILAIGMSACSNNTKYKPVTVDNRGEAGVILLSVNSTIPWSEASTEMAPEFDLANGDAALKKVIRSTARVQQQILDTFGVGLGIGLGQTSTAPDAPTTPPSNSTPPTLTGGQDDIGVDPFLEYKAAQSLYQYVKLLNAEVRNAAIRKGYVPHIVMLKLTPMLYRRNLSYDIHATISFFHTKLSPAPDHKLPYVVPILATDNLERAIKSSVVEVSRQVGLALNAMISGTGANLSLAKLNRNLHAIEASDFNSLLTVGRLTDNSLYIRLGAASQATARFAAIGKTYDIATLVLVPHEYYKSCNRQGEVPTLSIISRTELRNAFTGEQLNETPQHIQIDKFEESLRPVLKVNPDALKAWDKKTPDEKYASLTKLAAEVHKSDWNGFETAAKKEGGICKLPDVYLKPLWHVIAGITADSSFKSASVQLKSLPSLKIPSQTAILRDYGEKGMEVVLRNVSGAHTGAVTGRLVYESGEEFPAETITVEPDAQLLRLRFVSPKPWKLDPKGSSLCIKASECHWGNACPENDLQDCYPVAYLPVLPVPPPLPSLDLRQTLKVIVANKGKGDTTIFIDRLEEDSVELTVEGARIVSANDDSNKPIPVSKQRVMLNADTSVNLSLDNLRPGIKVTIKATGLKKAPGTNKPIPTGSKKVDFEVVKAE